MNKFLAQYAWEIMDLGKENHVDNGVARAMFVANLNNYGVEGAEFYPGADVDYAALSEQWRAMDKGDQDEAKIACGNLMRDCYDALSEARRNNDMAAYYRVILNYEAPEVEKPPYLLYTHAWDIWDKADAEGTDLETAKAAYIETLPEWAGLTEEQKAAEEYFFQAKVVSYDKGLQYARLTGDRDLFESILATR